MDASILVRQNTEEVLQASLPALKGAEIARMVTISMLFLYLYDWAITLDDEVKYFWRGSWSPSKVLFILNRYLVPTIIILAMSGFSLPNPIPSLCKPVFQSGFYLNVIGLAVIQLMLVLRIYHLFSHSNVIRVVAVASFATSLTVSLYFTHVATKDLNLLPTHLDLPPPFPESIAHLGYLPSSFEGCRAARPIGYWRIVVPGLVLHTLLYLLTAVQAIQNRAILKKAPMLKKLLRDGGFFYLVVLVSVTVSSIGSFMVNDPIINVPSIFSPYTITFTSIALSRVLLSIHSFSAKLGSDTPWVLNIHQLQGLRCRKGSTDGEIYVDRGGGDGQYDLYTEDDERDEYPVYDGRVHQRYLSFDSESGMGKGEFFEMNVGVTRILSYGKTNSTYGIGRGFR